MFWVVSGRRDLGSGELRSGLWASCVGEETLVTQPLPKDRAIAGNECRNLSGVCFRGSTCTKRSCGIVEWADCRPQSRARLEVGSSPRLSSV